VLQWSGYVRRCCRHRLQNASSVIDCPHIHSLWLAPGKALVSVQQWPPPKHKQFGGFQDWTSFYAQHSFFLSIVTAVYGKNLSYPIEFCSFSAANPIQLPMQQVIASKHVKFWIFAFQTVASCVKWRCSDIVFLF